MLDSFRESIPSTGESASAQSDGRGCAKRARSSVNSYMTFWLCPIIITASIRTITERATLRVVHSNF